MNIKLRYLEPSDLDNLFSIENDERYWHLSEVKKPYTKEDLFHYIQSSSSPIEAFGQLRFVIDIDSNLAGLIDLYDYDSNSRKAGVGIILVDEYQKKGIANKSLELLKDYCKVELNLKLIAFDNNVRVQ